MDCFFFLVKICLSLGFFSFSTYTNLKQGRVLFPALQVNFLMDELAWFLLRTDKAAFSSQWAVDGERGRGALSP